VRYVQALKKLGERPYAGCSKNFRREPGSQSEYRSIKLLAEVASHISMLLIGHRGSFDDKEDKDHLSVEELLTVASSLSHLLFFIFRHHKSNFVPNQNYRNWQDAIKNVFAAVTLLKSIGRDEFYWFLNSTQRLEQLFGIVRSMRGGDLNFDCLGLQERLGKTAGIAQYMRHPEWKPSIRRLTCAFDRKNTHSWKGDTRVMHIDEAKCWNSGRERAITILCDSQIFTNDELCIYTILQREPGVDMLCPYLAQIGVLADDHALIDLSTAYDDEDEQGV